MAWPTEQLWFKCNDNAANTTVVDSSVNGLNGTLNGGDNTSTISVSGKINLALDMNGTDDYVSVADNAALDFTTNLTVVLWYKPDALAANEAIMCKWTYATQGSWAFQTGDTNSDELYCFVASALNDVGLNGCQTSNANLVADGTWYQIAFVYDGAGATNADRLKFYKNATLLTTDAFDGTIPSSLQNSTASVNMAFFGGSLSRYNGAAFDDVRVFGSSLTSQQITALYNSGNGTESSLASLEPSSVKSMALLGVG